MVVDPTSERNACEGKCCAVFMMLNADSKDWSKVIDGEFIQDMLVPLTAEQALARAERFGVPLEQATLTTIGSDTWAPHTCRHWDEETKLCTVYEQRPLMCRDYPYEGECHHGCSFKADCATQEAYRTRREEREQAADG